MVFVSVMVVLLGGMALTHISKREKKMFGFLRRLFGSDSSENNDADAIGGAETVFHAILENVDGDRRYIAELGEPELIDRGGQFSSDYMVRIPTFTASGDPNPPNIEYDLPDAEMGETTNELFELLDYYNIDQVSDLADLEGEQIVTAFENGVLSLQFDEPQP